MSKKDKAGKKEKEMIEEPAIEPAADEQDGSPQVGEETATPENGAESELEKKDKEIATLKDQLMRNMAEYDNYRKRTSRERIELEPEITSKVVAEFLTVADSLERALSADCSDENYKKGVQMIYDSFMETMNKLGVEQIPDSGAFDPSMHQAVQQVPAGDGQESGEIASTFQKGYRIGNRILRFAMVAVFA